MAEIATIARPYAEALFKSSATGGLSGVAAVAMWLEELAVIAENTQLRQFADNPKVTSNQIFEVVKGAAKADWTDQTHNFLRTVIDNNRLTVLPEIAAQFLILKNRLSGSADAVVYSAFPIAENVLGELVQLLERRFARKLNVSVELEPELIGGVRVVVGDEVLDTSVKARLQQMKVALTA